MAAVVSGFEGFEKRLELHFFGDDPLGLRRLPIPTLQLVLDAVQCSIVSAAGNRHFDAYVLSESSLFVYPRKIIIKTCGTTQLLNSLPLLLRHAAAPLGLTLSFCRYSRGSFLFPRAQPFPHSSFRHEVHLLDSLLPPRLSYRKASVMPGDGLHSWHVYSAASAEFEEETTFDSEAAAAFTLEVCMTGLDRGLASAFCRAAEEEKLEIGGFSGDEAGRGMTEAAGIGGINPRSLVFGFAFDPCGYSMNGLDRDRYSTVHVTPEDGYSYASFECDGERWGEKAAAMLARAVRVFGPSSVSVSVTGGSGSRQAEDVWRAVEGSVGAMGLECRARLAEDYPGAGMVTYQTFTAKKPCRK